MKSRRTTVSKFCAHCLSLIDILQLAMWPEATGKQQAVLVQHGGYSPAAPLLMVGATDALTYTQSKFWVLDMARGLTHAGLTLFHCHGAGTAMSPLTFALHHAQLPRFFVCIDPPSSLLSSNCSCSPGLVSSRIVSLPSCPTPILNTLKILPSG